MVFESIVVELINRYLGEFVENLDTSQLKIGIWGGDVVLNNLNLKESALDELDLPVKIKAGHIGKLTLKIPWKNLYTAPVVAEIDGIYALAVPNIAIKYDEAKNQKAAQDEKQAKLQKIEDIKKMEAEKDKPKDPKQDTFVEKLATQVIKNLQIRVSKIHVRYEDKYTNPDRPVGIGVTLQELLFQTTDENWKETVIKEAVTQIYKLIRLDSLSVYWNSKAAMIQDKDKETILSDLKEIERQVSLKESIPKQGHKPNLQYIFRPISAVAHLRLNTKPELNQFTIPKVFLTLVFDEIAVNLSKDQYDDVLELLESMERMNLLSKYKKTRPSVGYKGHYKDWWHHAYSCVLEHTVRRRRLMWSWDHIKKHRLAMREYKALYTKKLEGKRMAKSELEMITNYERDLDVFHIVLIRNQAEVNAKKLEAKKAVEKSEGGWLGGWFGGKKKKEASEKSSPSKEADDLGNKFQEEFSGDEKAKLYQAIGYDENAVATTLPVEFVAVRLVTKLNKLSVTLMDSRIKDGQLLRLSLSEICASFSQRPAASAIRLDAKVERLRVTGTPRKDYTPKMVNSVGVSKDDNSSLLTVAVETNPLDAAFDTRIHVLSRPLEVIYDAITVNGMAEFFKPPESVRLKQFSDAAMAKYNVIKTQTATGMMHAMEDRKYTEIDIHLMPSYVIVPATGQLQKDVDMLLLNLGSLTMTSEKNKSEGVDQSKMTLEQVQDFAYDKFNISLENIQLLFVQAGDSWQDPNRSVNSPLYVLRPLSLHLLLEKCLFTKDPNLPQMRMSGELPLVSVAMSDSKLVGIMKLVQSIPFPEGSPPEEKEDEAIPYPAEVPSSFNTDEVDFSKVAMRGPQQTVMTSEYVNLTGFSMSFLIKEVSLEVMETKEEVEYPLLKLTVTRIGASMKQRTFDLSVDAYLGGIYLQHLQYKVSQGIRDQLAKFEVVTGELINIINTPLEEEDEPLLAVNFLQADKKGPEFRTTYNSTAQSITVQFSTLDLVLHQGVILSLLTFAKKIQPAEPQEPSATTMSKRRPSISSIGSAQFKAAAKSASTAQKETKDADVLALKVRAMVDSIQLGICNETCLFMHSKVEGIEFGATMHKDKMGITALMRKLELSDPDPMTLHPKILAVSGSEVLRFDMMMFNGGTEGRKFDDVHNIDMDVSLNMGRARIVFVNKFVVSLMNFLDNFAMAKAKLDEAGKAMKEASKDVAKNFQEKAPRIKLGIVVKAPLVVVPQNSRSLEVLMVNLGDVSIRSHFEKLQDSLQVARPGHAHIVENLTVELTNLQLVRGILAGGGSEEVKAEILILDPMTFKIHIRRNLSSGWFIEIPDIEVNAALDSIVVRICQEDMSMAMNMLDQNLTEIDPNGPLPAARESVRASAVTSGGPAQLAAESQEAPAIVIKPTVLEPVTEAPYTKIKVDFKIIYIGLELFKGSSNLTTGQQVRKPEKMLAQLCLRHLGLLFSQVSDHSMTAKVFLEDFTLDDRRLEKKEGITKMIRRTAFKDVAVSSQGAGSSTGDESNVIDLDFEQNSTEDKTVTLHVCSLHICVCLEFLMRVAEFFTSAMPPPKPKTIEGAQAEQAQNASAAGKKESPTTPTAGQPTASAPPPQPGTTTTAAAAGTTTTPAAPPAKGSLDVTLKLDKPEIYLIEDQMNPQTNSLIVDVAVNFRMRQNPDVMSINGAISNLSLVSCIFGKPDTRQNVLSPCDITLIGSAPQSRDHHIDVTMSDFIINVSPSTIRLLTAVSSGLSPAPEDAVVEVKLEDYSSIWLKRKLSECNFWFTHAVAADVGTSVDLALPSTEQEVASRGEQLVISAPVLVIKLEGGVGHRTVPLLIVEAAFSGQVHNWSSQLFVESSLSMEVAYYNEKLGVWEPILEPVLDTERKEFRKWEIAAEVSKNDEIHSLEEEETSVLPPPKMSINVTASDPLQILMTRTCLDVLNNLGKAFNEAYQLQEFEGTMGAKIIPFVFRNHTGETMCLTLDACFVAAPEAGNAADPTQFRPGQELQMNTQAKRALVQKQESVIKSALEQEERRLSFQMCNDSAKHEVSIKQAKTRQYALGVKSSGGDTHQVVCDVEALIGQKIVTFSSILRVKNRLDVAMEILYHDSSGMQSCGKVGPGELFHVPLAAVYCSTGEIFFHPALPSLSTSKECIKWKGLNEGVTVKQITCEATEPGETTYFFNVRPEFEHIFIGDSENLTGQVITLNLHPTVILHNLLPIPVCYLLEGMPEGVRLEAGQNVALTNAAVNQSHLELIIPEYRDCEWSGKKLVKLDAPELSVWTFQANQAGKTVYMDLGLHSKELMGSFDLTIYSPYWIVNLSQQTLALKEDDKEAPLITEASDPSIMLFYFRDKPIFGGSKRKVQLKVGEGEWSDKFSLDTVGSSGNVASKHKAGGYTLEVGVKIHLSASGLTKIVTFSPYYMLLNASTLSLCVQEENSQDWTCLDPGECKPYYPTTATAKDKEVKVRAKVKDAETSTELFFLNKAHNSLLRLDDQYGGINADCQVRESAMITTFKLYLAGMATVQFVNHTSQCTVKVRQSGSQSEPLSLEPQTSALYTWEKPTGTREILWTCGNKKDVKNTLEEDKIDEFFAEDDVKVYFVSFLDGMQRVVMFTQDLALATVAQEAGELEQADQEINLRIHDMGFSLINNEQLVEIAYMGITSSGVIWEEKKKRFKAMKLKDVGALEHGYQRYLMEISTGKNKNPVMMLENKIEVDFEKMEMLKPRKCVIRRSFEDGIWVQYRTSPHSTQLHAKINRLQFDNQLRQAIFPTVLSPLPPPKSVAADSVPKPFVEISLMMRIHEHSELMQIKYFKVLVQEMNLKVDKGFLNATLEMFASGEGVNREQEAIQFETDIGYSKRDLKEEAGLSIQAQKVSFYDYFHVSPIKVHLSFSLQGDTMTEGSSPAALQANVLNVFLQSVGVVLTDVQDVVFKLGYFERNHKFYNPSQLTSEFVRHYSSQAVKQMYVLVLGLDVLGNPFGLLRGLSEGIEDLFYEPYQGAIQGPEEFAEGLALGVRSLFGHAVGGAAGAVSRITGTLGKGLAALTLDDDYQKKRREQLNKRPATAREGFARGGKGLVMGVFDGVTGIVRKPVEGAKQDGVAGFFKGMGKGLVGVVTRPTSGVVDFASSSLEGIRRITDFSEEIHRLRPPRRLNRDKIIRPYVREEAEGYNLLLETEKGKFVDSDEYIMHAKVKEDGKIVFIVTDKRVMLAKRGEIFGSWDTEWVYTYQELKGAPKATPKGIEIILKEKEKKKLFGSNAVKKDSHLADPKQAQVLIAKITEAMAALNLETGV